MSPLRIWLLYAFVTLFPVALSTSSILLKGGTVISFNTATNSLEVLPETSVLITGNQVSALIPASQDLSLPDGTETIDVTGKIVSPGFVDTHRHGWQTAFKTIGSNTTLVDYLQKYSSFSPASTLFTPEDVYIGQLAGLYESVNSGVTSVLEYAHHTWSNATAAAGLQGSIDSGARVWWSYAIEDLPNGFTAQDQLADLKALVAGGTWKNSTVLVGVAYDNFQLDPADLVQQVIETAKEIDAPVVTAHYLGGPFGGSSLVQTISDLGFLNTSIPIVLAHAVGLTQTDASLLRSTNQYLSITAESEQHYGHGHAFSHLIQDQASLGVDTHFTFSTDIIGQARLWLQTARTPPYVEVLNNFEVPRNSPMSAHQAFLLATRNGGLALRRPDLGIIAVGATADLVVFDGDSPNMLGWSDPMAAIILHSHVGDIRHVLVDGQFRKKDGELVFGNWTDVKQRFLASSTKIQALWANMTWPPIEGTFANSPEAGLVVEARTLDVLRGNGTGY